MANQRQFSFTAAGSEQFSIPNGASLFAIQVTGVGAAATAWDVDLDATLDGTNYTTIDTHATGDGNGVILWTTTPTIAQNLRVILNSVTLGSATAVEVRVLAGG